MSSRKSVATRTATHRPAVRRRRNRHDEYTCVDLFSGFGGLTLGIEAAGFTAITAANHNAYKVEVHEANHPHVEHWIADLVDRESSDYHDVRQLPAADLLVAGVSCVNHSQANSSRAYEQQASLFDTIDEEYEANVTRSERDRATANCVLHYAQVHHPLMILVECTTELTSWGVAIEGKRKVGDGSTYRWWKKQIANLGYRNRTLYLNSRFFGVDQSRDRLYEVWWKEHLPAPDLDHRPITWCGTCEDAVEARWTWRTGIPPSGSVRYGKQYDYRCPRCRNEVVPPSGFALRSLDLTDLGTKIGDRKTPLAASTMARAERCRQRFAEFPAVLMPAKALGRGTDVHPWQPLPTQTSQQERALLHVGVDNFQGVARGVDDALPTQGGSETMGLLSGAVVPFRENGQGRALDQPMQTVVGNAYSGGVGVMSSGVLPYRANTVPTTHAEAMPTVTSEQVPGLLTAAGRVQNNGDISEAKYRAHPLDKPLGTVVGSANQQGLLFSGWMKQNGSTGTETAPHGADEPLATLTSRDTTAMLHAEWVEQLSDLRLEDCYFRMMREHEIGRGCGFDVDHGQHRGTYKVWGSARDQVDGFGNAVSPQVGMWIGERMRVALHGS